MISLLLLLIGFFTQPYPWIETIGNGWDTDTETLRGSWIEACQVEVSKLADDQKIIICWHNE